MFPLKKRQLIRGFEAHINAGLGGAADYVADKDTLYAPFSGTLFAFSEPQGGTWLRLTRPNGDKLEFAHLSKYIKKTGQVSEGEPIAITGNTGTVTSGAHLHLQILNSKGSRIDPEAYDWNPLMLPITIRACVLLNNALWPSTATKVKQLEDWFWSASGGKIKLLVDVKQTTISGWDYRIYGPGVEYEIINPDWYKSKVLPQASEYDAVLFVVRNDEWTGHTPPGAEFQGHCYGNWDIPISAYIIADENESSFYYPQLSAFVDYARHELIHGLYQIGHPSKFDFTHKHFYELKKPEACFMDYDYGLMGNKINSRKIKIRYVGWNDKEKGYYIPADTMDRLQAIDDFLKTQPKYIVDLQEWNLGKRPWG